ncbi:unnamed protein product [Musa acuminata subsp. burmannicoides]
MRRPPKAFLLLFLLLLLSASCSGSSSSSSSFVPSTTFSSNLRFAFSEIQKLTSLISHSSGVLGGNLRLSSAIHDCLDLLDFSADELTWTLSVVNDQRVKTPATGNHRYDIHSWLSAAVGNQDTCKEGLDSAGGPLGGLAAGGLKIVSSLIANSLHEVAASSGGGGEGRRLLGFPEWVSAGDRRLLQTPAPVEPDAVVAQDGSGDYTSIGAAVEAAPSESESRYVIYVKKGVYMENVEVNKKKWNLMLVGDGIDQTIISGSRSVADGWTTFRSPTVAATGRGFIARDLTIENTAGPQGNQAVAFRSGSDLSVFYRCGFSGYQDTLYPHSLRQFYRECRIAGTVDFIFGDAAVVFQSCDVLSRLPSPGQINTITAQGRRDPDESTGFSFQFCNVSADADLVGNTDRTATYLGRPWRQYSRTVFMQSFLDTLIRPEGWVEWNGNTAGLDTLYYAEYMNDGPGSGLEGRVNWPGYHAISDPAEAGEFTVAQFIDGDAWLPATGVKYTSGLTM